jgi:myo-inositol-1(or 4)-monophosphatase
VVPPNGDAGTIDHDELLARALNAARAAGQLLLTGPDPATRGELNVRSKSTSTDAVSDMDLQSERLIVQMLREGHERDVVLAEEGTQGVGSQIPGASDHGTRWIVDPLDGTVNYLYGLPHWGVSIAGQRAGRTLVGVVVVPALGEEFWAVAGAGAWHLRGGGEPARLGPMVDVPLSASLVATGFAYAAERRIDQAAVVAALAARVRDIRRLGAAAVDLAHTALGRVDAFYESGLQPWDLAAGELIVREAGGLVTGLSKEEPGPAMVIAGAPSTQRALREALRHAATRGLVPEEPTVP